MAQALLRLLNNNSLSNSMKDCVPMIQSSLVCYRSFVRTINCYTSRKKIQLGNVHLVESKVLLCCYSRVSDKRRKSEKTKKIANEEKYKILDDILDLREPHKWYPMSRKIKRKFLLHIGPTNSGKTHEAMNCLLKSSSGLYCAPLRLLAEQGFEKINRSGLLCDLVTGEKVIRMARLSPRKRAKLVSEDAEEANKVIMQMYRECLNFQEFDKDQQSSHVSATMEMVDVGRHFDCAVIDEYQLIGDPDRGWAWTRAILGICADVIHLCGDCSALEIIKQLTEITGDELEIKEYERLSPLLPHHSLKLHNWIEEIKSGDAIIAFSKKTLYDLKHYIESRLGPRTCIVYGALPSDIRTSQIKAFNEPSDNRDILVASDAIGLGMNLNIGRIVFFTNYKFDGKSSRKLLPNEVRQIAGRAGRYASKYPLGHYCGIEEETHNYILSAMEMEIVQVQQAALGIQLQQILELQKIVQIQSLYELFEIIENFATISGKYFLQNGSAFKKIARKIDQFPLSINQKFVICSSPVNTDDTVCLKMIKAFAEKLSRHENIKLPSFSAIKYIWCLKKRLYLEDLELIYKFLEVYIWLSYRIKNFVDAKKALRYKLLVQKKILEYLKGPAVVNDKKDDCLEYQDNFEAMELKDSN